MNAGVYTACGVAVLVAAAAAIGFGAGSWHAQRTAVESSTIEHAPKESDAGRKVLYWYDPMVPQQKFDKPGKSPFMDMMLVPKYADDAGGVGVRIDPALRQNLGMRFATVAREPMSTAIDVVAQVGFDERNVAIVQARSNAYVQRVYPHAPLDVIAAGAPLADLLVPEWWGAQHEFLALRDSGDQALLHAARSRMRLLGMPDALIERVEREGTPQTTLTIRAPIAGVIQELGVRSGMTLSAGATLARINSIASVWLEAAVPETQAAFVRVGAEARARFAAYPEEPFKGRITALLPEASRETRTLRVRIELPNPALRLRPGMFAQVTIAGRSEEALVVPAEAVIRTGRRAVVFLVDADGTLAPVEVELGAETDGKLVVRTGLREGQQVVASSQFLIDSEASLRGVLGRRASAVPARADVLHEGSGRITALEANEVTLAHGPIPSLRWGAMTMAFKLARPELSAGLKANDEVHFRFRASGDEYVIEQLEKAGGPR
jgi:Cu(I)/Ag(I) efflux system membrane fusion protein